MISSKKELDEYIEQDALACRRKSKKQKFLVMIYGNFKSYSEKQIIMFMWQMKKVFIDFRHCFIGGCIIECL